MDKTNLRKETRYQASKETNQSRHLWQTQQNRKAIITGRRQVTKSIQKSQKDNTLQLQIKERENTAMPANNTTGFHSTNQSRETIRPNLDTLLPTERKSNNKNSH